jgi:hypothetical protein
MSYIVQALSRGGGGSLKERNASVKPNNSLLDILFNAYKRMVGTVPGRLQWVTVGYTLVLTLYTTRLM